jgi:hypothetical protein
VRRGLVGGLVNSTLARQENFSSHPNNTEAEDGIANGLRAGTNAGNHRPTILILDSPSNSEVKNLALYTEQFLLA